MRFNDTNNHRGTIDRSSNEQIIQVCYVERNGLLGG
jgi:hypothetical protein